MFNHDPDDPVCWDQPVFVISAGRSGSTHLTNILSSHPDLAMTHESNIAHYIQLASYLSSMPLDEEREVAGLRLRGLIPERYSGVFAEACLSGLTGAWQEFYRRQFADKPFRRWGDKFQFPEVVPELARLFPKAKWFHIVRDGRDVVCSALRHHLREGEARGPGYTLMTFEQHCEYWARLNQQLREGLSGASDYMVVRYEELITDEAALVPRLLSFAELEPSDKVAHFLQEGSKKVFEAHGTSNNPAASIGRWRGEIDGEQLETLMRIQGSLLAEFGY